LIAAVAPHRGEWLDCVRQYLPNWDATPDRRVRGHPAGGYFLSPPHTQSSDPHDRLCAGSANIVRRLAIQPGPA
jgi:hypothetical protein